MNSNLTLDSYLKNFDYEVVQDWNGGFKAELDFTTSQTLSDGWQLEFNAPFQIRAIYGAKIVNKQGNNYTIGNLDGNTRVNANQEQNIIIIADYLNEPATNATNFKFSSLSTMSNTGGNNQPNNSNNLLDEIEFEIVQDWRGGFKAELDFTATKAINDGWQLKFEAPFGIREIYGAEVVSQKENTFTIGNLDGYDQLGQGEEQNVIIIANDFNQAAKPATNFSLVAGDYDMSAPMPEPSMPEPSMPEPPTSPPGNPTPPTPPSGGDVSRPSYNKSEGFFTLNGRLYDANGNDFVPRGINNLHVWFDDNNDNVNQAYDALDNIASFGFNSVRIVWEVDFLGRPTNDSTLESIIQRTIDLKMVPMVSIHDFTGSKDSKALLDTGVKWWTDRADIWQKYEKHLIIDVANEFGNHTMAYKGDRREFPNIYKEAITRMRNSGIDNTLVIEPFDWGKDYTLIRDHGQEIYNHDPQKNVMFSPHLYCGQGESSATIRDMFDSLTGKELPFMVGEFAHKHPRHGSGGGDCDVQEQTIMSEAQEHGIGHFAWAWNNGVFSVGNNWEANSRGELTSWGQDLVYNDPNSISNTSEIATIF